MKDRRTVEVPQADLSKILELATGSEAIVDSVKARESAFPYAWAYGNCIERLLSIERIVHRTMASADAERSQG